MFNELLKKNYGGSVPVGLPFFGFMWNQAITPSPK